MESEASSSPLTGREAEAENDELYKKARQAFNDRMVNDGPRWDDAFRAAIEVSFEAGSAAGEKRVEELRSRLAASEAVVESARAFDKQYDIVAPHIDGAFFMQHLHSAGAQYSGPTIEKERKAMKGAIAALSAHDKEPK